MAANTGVGVVVSEIGKPKFEYEHHDIDHDLFDRLEAACNDKFEQAMDTDDKTVRDAGIREIVDAFEATLEDEYKEEHLANLSECVDKLEKKAHLKGQKVTKYKYLGLMLFVAIPLPGTGAWTGCLAAGVFGYAAEKGHARRSAGGAHRRLHHAGADPYGD